MTLIRLKIILIKIHSYFKVMLLTDVRPYYTNLLHLSIRTKTYWWRQLICTPDTLTYIMAGLSSKIYWIMALNFNIVVKLFETCTCRRQIIILNTNYYESPFEKLRVKKMILWLLGCLKIILIREAMNIIT